MAIAAAKKVTAKKPEYVSLDAFMEFRGYIEDAFNNHFVGREELAKVVSIQLAEQSSDKFVTKEKLQDIERAQRAERKEERSEILIAIEKLDSKIDRVEERLEKKIVEQSNSTLKWIIGMYAVPAVIYIVKTILGI